MRQPFCLCSAQMDIGESFTKIILENIDSTCLWDKCIARSPGRPRDAYLKWGRDIVKGIRSQYQLYFNNPCDYAARLMELIYWQDRKGKKVCCAFMSRLQAGLSVSGMLLPERF